MKIKINKKGFLEIKRLNIFKQMGCPFKKYSFCGDWCALFNEPEDYNNGKEIFLMICKNQWFVKKEDFIDERG